MSPTSTLLHNLKLLKLYGDSLGNLGAKLLLANPMTFCHTTFEDGTIVTLDEGKVTFTIAGAGTNITLAELNDRIKVLEKDIGEVGE